MAEVKTKSSIPKITFRLGVGFHPVLRERVDHYFQETGLRKTGDWRMFLKTTIILARLAVSYVLLVDPIYCPPEKLHPTRFYLTLEARPRRMVDHSLGYFCLSFPSVQI